MKFAKLAIAAAVSAIAMGASAMDLIDDAGLSATTGQDGVSIAANLNVSIGSFAYQDASGDMAFGFNGIKVTGALAANIDMLSHNMAVVGPATLTATSEASLNIMKTLGVTALRGASAAQAADVTTLNALATAAGLPAAYSADTATVGTALSAAAFAPTGDVVKIALPTITAQGLNISVDSMYTANKASIGTNTTAAGLINAAGTTDAGKMTTGTNWGSIAVNNLQLGGTTAYIWVH
ncbi:hypothetical protein KSF73_03590 [Burkholderiaceae bacterium DAT-1]|nr:hypothetical protein [Burkholderiaceae bacterium DAT-1]